MIIVMPDNPRGLTFLEHSLKTSQNDPSAENLFDIAYEALEPQRNTRTEHVVTMPPFTIDSKISVTKYLQRVYKYWKKKIQVNFFKYNNFSSLE
jgi:hypothetical protein